MSLKRRMKRRTKGSPTGVEIYDIVYHAMPSESSRKLSAETSARLPQLHAQVVDDPRSALPVLRGMIEREPVPLLYNWLAGALRVLGEAEAMEEVIRENYRNNPDYLFARLNYAEICLRDNNLAGVREALGERMDLRALLPGRKRFHVSEVVGFFYAVALYRLETDDLEAAEKLYGMLEEMAPDEPCTIELREILWPASREPFAG